MTEFVQTDFSDGVFTLRMYRPERRNAMNGRMYTELAEMFDAAEKNPAVRVLLLVGSNDCFTSGNDLNEPPDGLNSALGRFIAAVMSCEKPLLAAPCGIAVGIGLTLLPHCDIVVCGERTKFHAPFVQLAVCPELGSSYTLPRLLGYQRAAAILLTGDPFDAALAREIGLVNEIAPNAEAENTARAIAARIAKLPPKAVRTTKSLMRRWSDASAHEANRIEMNTLVKLASGPEAKEAVAAFLAKREPDFAQFD